MSTLLPCPFCGMTKNRGLFFDNIGDKYKEHWAVSCSGCIATGPVEYSKEEAITAWNNRTQTTTETSCDKNTTNLGQISNEEG